MAVLVLTLQLEQLMAIALSWLAGRCSQPSVATDAFSVLLHPPLGGRGCVKQAGPSGPGFYS